MAYLDTAKQAGVRISECSDMTNVGFINKPYPAADGGPATTELSLHMCWTAPDMHVPGAVPVIDVLKYVMRAHPELLARAQAEMAAQAA